MLTFLFGCASPSLLRQYQVWEPWKTSGGWGEIRASLERCRLLSLLPPALILSRGASYRGFDKFLVSNKKRSTRHSCMHRRKCTSRADWNMSVPSLDVCAGSLRSTLATPSDEFHHQVSIFPTPVFISDRAVPALHLWCGVTSIASVPFKVDVHASAGRTGIGRWFWALILAKVLT